MAAWAVSPRKEKMQRIDAEYPFSSFLKLTTKLSRHDNSLLVQLRSGHFPLRDYLYKRRLSDTDICGNCKMRRRETLDHVFKECPAYNTPRRALATAIHTRGMANPRKVLNNENTAKAVITFVKATGRWTNGYMRTAEAPPAAA